MPEANGSDDARHRLEQRQEMDKLLLRTQLLQQRALEENERAIERHEKWIAATAAREKRLDERIDNLVSAMGEFISRIPGRSG
jgi:galactose-1-phosphate uridylyltransferase